MNKNNSLSNNTYTIHDNHKINSRVESDLILIKNELISCLGTRMVKAILLVGGFGRSEGGILVTSSGLRPVNDYDLLIVFQGSFYLANILYRKRISAIANKLSRKIGIKQIDIGITTEAVLEISQNTIYNYELLEGYQIIWGDIVLKASMPSLTADNIPLLEGTMLLLNRGGGLLIAARYFSSSNEVPDDKKEYFAIECQKAILAMGDCILLMEGLYNFSYKKRIANANKLLSYEHFSILEIYIEALESKIQPTEESFSKYSINDWFDIVAIYEQFYLMFEKTRLKSKFTTWLDYINNINSSKKFNFKNIAKMISRLNFNQYWQLKNKGTLDEIFLRTLPLLLFSFKRDNQIDYQLLSETEKTFIKCSLKTNNWINKWEYQVDQYLSIWHP